MNKGRTSRPAQPNLSLQCGVDCLLQLASASAPLGSREMARLLGREHTRVNRLLGTLAHMGLAEKTPDRKYVPGPGVHLLAAMSLKGSGLLKTALPHIRTLMGRTGERIALGVLWADHVCYLFHGGPDEPLEASIAPGNLYPADRSSIGMVMNGRFTGPGYAVSPSGSLAVPVGDPAVAGLAVSGKVRRNSIRKLVTALRATADAIEGEMR